jgi:hypothetical protein
LVKQELLAEAMPQELHLLRGDHCLYPVERVGEVLIQELLAPEAL